MQTTLLGLAIAIILALVTALVGPLFVDWERFRPQFEAEATRLIGAPVRVGGTIDVRLLPSPSLILSDIEIGAPSDANTVKARALGIEFALGPLMRGRFRAAQTRVIAPQITLALDGAGKVVVPKIGSGLELGTLAIDRLNIDEAKIVLANAAAGSRITLDRFWFHGEVRALAGAFRGEGAFILNGGLYGYRVATSQPDDTGTKIKLSIDPADRPASGEAEGTFSLDNGEPRFDGNLTLTRSAGVVLAGRQAVQNEQIRVTSRIKSGVTSALLEQIEFQYGPDERAVKLAGTAELKFGASPRFDAVLSGRQIDLDKLATSGDLPPKLPFAALKELKESFGDGLRPSLPVKIGVSIDSATLGGAQLQSLRGDISSNSSGWSLDNFEFRAPGFTQVRLSGKIDGSAGASFAGPVDATSTDPRALLAWLDGRSETAAATIRPLRARADVTLGAETIGVESVRAEIDRKIFEGRAVYSFARADRKARLDAAVRAAELDADAIIDFGKALLAGTTFDRPGELALALDLDRATLAGFSAKELRANVKYDTSGLQIERLSIADFGGMGLTGNGQIDTGGEAPRGNLVLELDAREWSGANALAAKFAPQSADDVRWLTGRIGPAKLRANLEVGKETAANIPTIARLSIEGNAGALKVNFQGEGQGDSKAPGSARIRIDGTLAADDSIAVIRAVGLDGIVPPQPGAGEFKFQAYGPADGELNISARLTAGELRAESHGTGRASFDKGVTASASLMVTKGGGSTLPLPFTLQSRIAIAGGTATLSDISASVSKTRIKGRLEVKLARPQTLAGKIETESLDAAALIGAAIGMPAPRSDGAWPTEPFLKVALPAITGRVMIQAKDATLAPGLQVRDLAGAIRLTSSELAFDDLTGQVAGGKFTGAVSFRRSGDTVNAQARMILKGSDARAVITSGEGTPISGKLNAQIEVEGTGLTPRALIGSINGTGTVSLEKGEIAKLDPKVFAGAMRAVDQGMPLDAGKLRDFVAPALDAGRLTLKDAEGAIGIVNGQARLGTVIAKADGADLAMSGNFDLVTQTLDARLMLTATNAPAFAGRPELTMSLKGTLAAPRREFDVSALAGWLALRAVDQQSKKLEQMEAERAGRTPLPQTVVPVPSPAASAVVPAPKPIAPLPAPLEIKPAPRAAVPARPDSGLSERDRFFKSQR